MRRLSIIFALLILTSIFLSCSSKYEKLFAQNPNIFPESIDISEKDTVVILFHKKNDKIFITKRDVNSLKRTFRSKFKGHFILSDKDTILSKNVTIILGNDTLLSKTANTKYLLNCYFSGESFVYFAPDGWGSTIREFEVFSTFQDLKSGFQGDTLKFTKLKKSMKVWGYKLQERMTN